jgi:hypothetical protein
LSNAADLSLAHQGIKIGDSTRKTCLQVVRNANPFAPPIESDKRFLELFSPSRLLDAYGMARVSKLAITLSIKPSQGVIDVQDERM